MNENFVMPTLSDANPNNDIVLFERPSTSVVYSPAYPGGVPTMDDPEGQQIFISPNGDVTE